MVEQSAAQQIIDELQMGMATAIQIIVFGGQKGGVGKSTAAYNIAVMAALAGKRVLLVDADRQQSLANFAAVRSEEKLTPAISCVQKTVSEKATPVTFSRELMTLAKSYDLVIVDVSGWDSDDKKNLELRGALLAADLFIVPTRPGPVDLWTLNHVVKLADNAVAAREEFAEATGTAPKKLRRLAILNFTAANQAARIHETREYFAEHLPSLPLAKSCLRNLMVYADSPAQGRGALEMRRVEANTRSELLGLYREIFGTGWGRASQGGIN